MNSQTFPPTPGSLVSCRNRQLVVLPSEQNDIVRLRPLSGNEDEIAGIYRGLNLENIEPATFPVPQATNVKDEINAIRLNTSHNI